MGGQLANLSTWLPARPERCPRCARCAARRPFRKNVQYIVLVRPSFFLRAVLAFMRPFVSAKAGRKIRQVQSLAGVGEVTGGEVTVAHLGRSFLEEQGAQEGLVA